MNAPHRTLSLLISASLFAGCASHNESEKEAPTVPPVAAEVLEVQPTQVRDAYLASGSVKAEFNASVASKVMARVEEVSVREGDFVRRGQLLVALDDRDLRADLSLASARLRASKVGVGSAQTAALMEEQTSAARVRQAETQVHQAESALAAAEARRDLVLAGPRTQEVTQAHLAVVQAESDLKLAAKELERMTTLVQNGAVSQRQFDLAQNRYDVAKGQYDTAVESEKIAREGARSQEVRAAQDAVAQARASVQQAQAAVREARAARLKIQVRVQDIEVARSQVAQTSAAVETSRVSLSYTRITAPFDGRVTARRADPGTMASMGTPLIDVEGGRFRLEATIPERILPRLTIGTRVPVELSTATLSGTVREVVPKGDATTHTFLVKLDLPQSATVRSGMYGTARVPLGQRSALLIPKGASWDRDGLSYVWGLGPDGKSQLRVVTTRPYGPDRVEVMSGLRPGERIVLPGSTTLQEGSRISEKAR